MRVLVAQIFAVTVACLLASGAPAATILTVRIKSDNGHVRLSIMAKDVNREQMKATLSEFAGLGKDMPLFVIVDDTVPAAALVSVLYDIQSTGLHNLMLSAPAVEDGKTGAHRVTLDCTKKTVGGETSGFVDFSRFPDLNNPPR